MTKGIPKVVVRAARKIPLSKHQQADHLHECFLTANHQEAAGQHQCDRGREHGFVAAQDAGIGTHRQKREKMSPAAINTDCEDEV